MPAADAVRQRLVAARIRPADLARHLGVSPQLAGQMLRGKRGIPTWHLDAIAVLLGVTVADLFQPTDGHTSQNLSRSELHSSAQSGVNSQGTRRAKRSASLRRRSYADEPLAPTGVPSAVAIAAQLIHVVTALQGLIHALVPLPDPREAATDHAGSTGSPADLREPAGSLAHPRTRRKAG